MQVQKVEGGYFIPKAYHDSVCLNLSAIKYKTEFLDKALYLILNEQTGVSDDILEDYHSMCVFLGEMGKTCDIMLENLEV